MGAGIIKDFREGWSQNCKKDGKGGGEAQRKENTRTREFGTLLTRPPQDAEVFCLCCSQFVW